MGEGAEVAGDARQERRGVADGAGPATGDAQVDQIVAVLRELPDLPVAEHAEVFLEVHARLGGELNPEQKLRQAGAHGSP